MLAIFLPIEIAASLANQGLTRVQWAHNLLLSAYEHAGLDIIQVAIDRIMRKALMVIRKVGLRVIRLSGEKKLTVVAPCWLHNSCVSPPQDVV